MRGSAPGASRGSPAVTGLSGALRGCCMVKPADALVARSLLGHWGFGIASLLDDLLRQKRSNRGSS